MLLAAIELRKKSLVRAFPERWTLSAAGWRAAGTQCWTGVPAESGRHGFPAGAPGASGITGPIYIQADAAAGTLPCPLRH